YRTGEARPDSGHDRHPPRHLREERRRRRPWRVRRTHDRGSEARGACRTSVPSNWIRRERSRRFARENCDFALGQQPEPIADALREAIEKYQAKAALKA